MRIGSLFSGIGGLELGLERAGLGPVIFQVEQDPYCRSVLARHWPNAERYDDVRGVSARSARDGDAPAGHHPLVGRDGMGRDVGCGGGDGQRRLDRRDDADGGCGAGGRGVLPPVDVLCGGFPCQDVSVIGKRAGLDGDRSGLWWEMDRLVGELRPTWVVVENVYAGHDAWLPDVRRSLWGRGYAAVPIHMRACDVGLPHRRARIFVVAYRLGIGLEGKLEAGAAAGATLGARDGAAYTGALRVPDGFPVRLVRPPVHAYGNAVVPACAEVVGRMIRVAEERA